MFEGIFTPIITPFDDNQNVDYSAMKHNLGMWDESKLTGLVVLGSNGEFAYLTEDEKIEIVDFVSKNIQSGEGRKKIIVGTYCESTRGTIELSKKVADKGADAVLVLPPNYYKGAMNEDRLYGHYSEVADNIPIPLFIYNMPGNTGINLSAGLVAKLSKHPNIVGIKDTAGNIVQLTVEIKDSDPDFTVFAGNAGYLLPALSVGAKGATLALANCLPNQCCLIQELFLQGNLSEAKRVQQEVMKINSLVTGVYGIPGLKAAMEILGYKGGSPRKPLTPVSDTGKKEIQEELKRVMDAL